MLITRQSQLAFSRRLRATPYSDRVMAAGVKGFTIYNHMRLPTIYRSLEEDYWHLVEHVQVWDVAAERQVEIRGPDALRLLELMTPRDMSRCAVGQCRYAPLVDEHGGLVNDPVVLRLADDRFWVSVADSDVVLWAKGLARGFGMDVRVFEPDVSPLAIQGPKSDDVAAAVFGDWVRDLRFFRFRETDLDGIPLVIARSGWSKQGGFELYLQDGTRGNELWDRVWEAGQPFGIGPGAPNLIERIESRLLSYASDMTMENNPFECGLDAFCDLDKPAPYLAREALARIAEAGVRRRIGAVVIEGEPILPNTDSWPVRAGSDAVGFVTTAAYSPRLGRSIAMAMLDVDAEGPLEVMTESGEKRTVRRADGDWNPI